MPTRVMIVEDEILIAIETENVLQDRGYIVTGIAPDAAEARRLAAAKPDIALVDLNLRDGLTGPAIGKELTEQFGIAVIFVTANPRLLGEGVPGTLGVVEKPVDNDIIGSAVDYARHVRIGIPATPPAMFKLFGQSASV